MSAIDKTPNLLLNRWAGTENPQRVDFVSDNDKIDAAVGNNTNLAAGNSRDISRLELAARKNGIISGQYVNKWFESPEVRTTDSIGLVDFGKTFAETINTGTDNITMTALQLDKNGDAPALLSECFKVGERITTADDGASNKEYLIIQAIDDGLKKLTFTTNIVNTYATGANCYRSNMVVNGQVWNFGAFSASETIDVTTPEQIVNAAYSTEGNGGRKVVTDSDGITYSAVRDAGFVRVYKRGVGEIWAINMGTTPDHSLALFGTKLYLSVLVSTTNVRVYEIDLDGTQTGNTTVDSSQSALGNTSISISEDGTKITATWSSKNATYPNSFNIRAIQGTILNGVITWGSVEQLTSIDSSGNNRFQPSVVYDNADNPSILFTQDGTGVSHVIYSIVYNGSTWNALVIVYTDGTYTQSNPSATFMPPSVATKINAGYTSGLIIVTWSGRDATDTTANNIRCRASLDGGATWFDFGVTNEKITTGGTYDQFGSIISWNSEGDIFIDWYGGTVASSGIRNIRQIENNVSTGYGTIEEVTNQSSSNIEHPNSVNNYHDFEKPLMIWKTTTDIKLYGKWSVGVETAVTNIDIRINMSQPDQVTSIQAFVRVDELAGLTVDAKASIVAPAADESYSDMTDSTTDLGDVNEIASSVVLPINDKVTVEYTMTRLSILDVVNILDFVGFVGV